MQQSTSFLYNLAINPHEAVAVLKRRSAGDNVRGVDSVCIYISGSIATIKRLSHEIRGFVIYLRVNEFSTIALSVRGETPFVLCWGSTGYESWNERSWSS